MRISKEKEKILRREFSLLKKRVSNQKKKNLIFARTKCNTLLRCLRQRWDYDINQLFEEEATGNIDNILHDLRND